MKQRGGRLSRTPRGCSRLLADESALLPHCPGHTVNTDVATGGLCQTFWDCSGFTAGRMCQGVDIIMCIWGGKCMIGFGVFFTGGGGLQKVRLFPASWGFPIQRPLNPVPHRSHLQLTHTHTQSQIVRVEP